MFAYLEILRPVNGLMAVLAVLVGAAVAGVPLSPLHAGIIFAALAVFLQSGAGMVNNDYFDLEIDKINKPLRPIPSGRVSPRNAKIYAGGLFALSLIFAYLINFYALGLAAFNVAVTYLYSSYFKRTPYGHLIVSYLVGSVYIFASLITEKIPAVILILSGLAFFVNFAREIAKGIEDLKADKKLGAKTLEVEWGKEKAAVAGIALTAIGILLSPLPIYFGIKFNYVYLAAAADLIFLYCAYLLWKTREQTLLEAETTGSEAQKFFKIGMIVALAAFVVGIL